MVKRAISITTILLAIFVVGIVYARANTRVSRPEAVDQTVYVVDDGARALVAMGRQVGFVEVLATNCRPSVREVTGKDFNVSVQKVGGFDEGAEKYAVRAVFTQPGGDEAGDLRQVLDLHQVVAADNPPALPDVHGQGYFNYLNNRHNDGGVMLHPRYDNLAVRSMRVTFPLQPGNVLSGLCPNDLQMVPVFETASVPNVSPVDYALAAPVSDSFCVSGLKALRRKEVFKTDQWVQRNAVGVNGNLVELGFVVG